MDRLTTRNPDGTVGIGHPLRYYNHEDIVQVLDRLAAYEDTGLEPETIIGLCEMDKRSRMAQMLRWEEAEAEGRLVVLPCKVGDTVFVPLLGQVFRFEVISVICHNNNPTFKAQHGMHFVWVFGADDIGKTVFLTREEAEQALKGE